MVGERERGVEREREGYNYLIYDFSVKINFTEIVKVILVYLSEYLTSEIMLFTHF